MEPIDSSSEPNPEDETPLDQIIREYNKAKYTKQETHRIETEVKSRRDSIRRLIEKRFGQEVAHSFGIEIESITDLDKLNLLFGEASSTTTIDELRKLLA